METYENLCFGLRWETALSDDKVERESLARGDDSNAYVDYTFDATTNLGFCQVKNVKGLVSAAAVFANYAKSENAIFAHSMGDKIALIVVQKYIPSQDDLLSKGEALQLIKAFTETVKESGGILKIFGEQLDDSVITTDLSLDQLVSIAESSKFVLKAVKTKDNTKILLFVFLAVMSCLTTAFFFDDIVGMFNGKPNQQQKSPKEIHKDQVKAAVTSIRNAHQFPKQTMDAFIPFANAIVWKLPGWELQSALCTGTTCTLTYERKSGGTAKSFLNTLKIQKEDSNVKFTNLDTAIRTVTFNAPAGTESLELLYFNDFAKQIMSWFQGLKDAGFLASNLSTPTNLVPPPPGPPADKADLIKVADYMLTLPFSELKQVSNIPNFMTVQTITISIKPPDRKVEAEIKGKYYAY
ncbi:MAG: type 4b pilus protein PilO2 [Candidatus Saccharibacteria bacterium]|nr:type 4b pilus protein PilO2 [Candidatus Saccharibacteria bacterium]